MISEDDIRRVREATDLVALVGERVVLKQRGRDYWGCCPFHNEKSPSFKVDPTTQLFHCFGCGEGGDVIGYLMKSDNMEFPDAIRHLAERAHIEIQETKGQLDRGKRTRLYEICEKTAVFYHHQLMRVKTPGSDAARAYLSQRGFGGGIPSEWMLGYAPGRGELVKHLTKQGYQREELIAANVALERQDHRVSDRFYERIIFPIFDLKGQTIAFGGRIVIAKNPETPKYLNSSDTPLFHKRESLYAIDRAKASMTSSGTAIVVEGYTDVIAMHRAGFLNTVATLGTALTPQHVKLLKRFVKRIIYLFDGDVAGLNAADKAATFIATELGAAGFENMDFLVAVLPEGSDPADFCEREGAGQMQAILDKSVPLLRFSLDRRLHKTDLASPEQKARALKEALTVLLPVRGSSLANDYLIDLADFFRLKDEDVRRSFEAMRAPRIAQKQDSAEEQLVDSTMFVQQDPVIELERELIIYAVAFPSVRPLLDASSKPELDASSALAHPISFTDPLHAKIIAALKEKTGWLQEQPAQLAARIIDALPEAAGTLGAGQTQTGEKEVLARARILAVSLCKKRLEREIGILTSKHRQAEREGASTAAELFREIVSKQQKLRILQKQFDELPKLLD